MKRIYLLLAFLLIYISSFGQILTITEVIKGKTYEINGISSGNELIASEVDDSTIRLFNKTLKSSNDYKTKSNFTDFFINGINPTDIENSVNLINQITNNTPQQSDYYLNVQQGNINDEFIVNKFGRNGSVGTTLSHISISGEYQTPITAQSLEVVSASTDDNISGIGAHKIVIEGLDSNYNIQKDTVYLNGTTPVLLNKQFIRVYRGVILESGTYVTTHLPSQVGQITLRNAGGGVTWFLIDTIEGTPIGFGIGQTQIGTYSVPKGYTAYLISKTFSIESTKPSSIYLFKREHIDDVTSPFTGTMRLFEQNDGITVPFQVNSKSPLNVIKGPAEVGFFAKTLVGTASISIEFQLLVKKDKI